MRRTPLLILLLFSFNHIVFTEPKESTRSFEIDYDNDQFLKDGEPFRYISGTIHYFRVRPEYWRDRLRKLRYAGFTAVQTYTLWASHEPAPGTYDFENHLDFLTYIKIAQEEDLLVILRPGPYIDAEIDMGGLPSWLLKHNKNIKLRTKNRAYLKHVDKWLTILYSKIKPYLYENGGPIIMIQIENEYGSYKACDFEYTSHLRDLTRHALGSKVVLFTTDGDGQSFLRCGKIPDVYATVDFGTGVDIGHAFGAQRLFEPRGPLINSEFYGGWFDHWGKPHSTVNKWIFSLYLDSMLTMNASVNVYVFHGGTSFGMISGSNTIGGEFVSCPTSYDYDAPLNEAGDPTDKYFLIRNITQKFSKLPDGPVPSPSKKYAYGSVQLFPAGNILTLTSGLKSVSSEDPLTFEDLSHSNGLVVYETIIQTRMTDPAVLAFETVHDRAYIFMSGRYQGIVSRQKKALSLAVYGEVGDLLRIVVESQGRDAYGNLNDWKGFTKITLDGTPLTNWKMIPIPMEDPSIIFHENDIIPVQHVQSNHNMMGVYKGSFEVAQFERLAPDTFLKMHGWRKGYAYINDFLLGRYWPIMGPQETLYIPGSLLKKGQNSITILELEESPCYKKNSCKIELVDEPIINGSVPGF